MIPTLVEKKLMKRFKCMWIGNDKNIIMKNYKCKYSEIDENRYLVNVMWY